MAATGSRPSLPAVREWWELPSGRIVCVRRIEGVGTFCEVVVRYVDDDGSMAQGEFNLTLAFLARGRKVAHA
jgi:hypothetical protein